MKVIIISLVLVLLSAVLVTLMGSDSGYVLINYRDYTLVTSLWSALFATLILTLVIIYAVRYAKLVISKGKNYTFKRNEKRSQAGLLHYVEGDLLSAKKELATVKSIRDKSEQSYLHTLLAARSALDLGLLEESEALLEQAENTQEKNTIALVINKVRLKLEQKQTEEAKRLLDSLSTKEKKHPAVVELYRQVYIQTQDWFALLGLLPSLKASKIYSEQRFSILQENTYMSYLNSVVQTADEDSSTPEKNTELESKVKRLLETWNSFPKAIKQNVRIMGLYCTLLVRLHEDDRAEILLRKALKSEWHVGLVELYGKLKSKDVKTQLAYAEAWLADHKEDAYLLFTLARLSLRIELWGKAKDYFEKSLKQLERPEVYAEFGALMEKLGEKETSTKYYRRGLEISVSHIDVV